MHPRAHALLTPERPAIVDAATGAVITFGDLEGRINRAARWLRAMGLREGDVVAFWTGNHPRTHELYWAAQNIGLLFVPVSTRLAGPEAAYIIANSGARLLVAATDLPLEAVRRQIPGDVKICLLSREDAADCSYRSAIAAFAVTPPPGETRGMPMIYSAGTTGRPKGVRPALARAPIDDPPPANGKLIELYGFDADTVYLSTAPLYHAAPLKIAMAVNAAGGTVVAMDQFDAGAALRLIARHRVSHSFWVPTMFVRLLGLPPATRTCFDLSSHRVAIHAAAPCPVAVKEAMLEWWGPVIHEFYGGSESIGMCAIGPEEWRARKGSVGKATRGKVHVLDDRGRELAPGETGLIYFEGAADFAYHGDPEATAGAVRPNGWATLGDVGHVDDDGYVYLTDRRDDVIIAGGVNIYPREAEELLSTHPAVADVAVFGIPNAEYGEEVKAVVQLRDHILATNALAAELLAYARAGLSAYKCPRSIDFATALPREPTGKLLKRKLRAEYAEHVEPCPGKQPCPTS